MSVSLSANRLTANEHAYFLAAAAVVAAVAVGGFGLTVEKP
jgi:hypothetical protein